MSSPGYLEPIAIIGVSSLFAGDATDTERLWKVLLEGKPSPSPFLNNKHYHPDQSRQGTIHAKAAYFIKEDTTAFDSSFFGLTKKEVLSMDPQQRVLLENTYHALENAGIPLEQAIGSNTSVFVGQCGEDFGAMCNSDLELAPTYKETGVERSIRANRISWFYDFKGASYVVDTACSSSLVALYTGCQDLLLHDSEMAIVSGITLIDHPSQFMGLDKLGAIGSDGFCYTFDSRANGYARGEGVGTVVLKRLSDAIHDGNTIRAVIRAASASSNGRTPGIFNPSADAQAALIASTYKKAGLDPNLTSFIEAHGTGTKAGDATEVKALSTAFNTAGRNTPMVVGAVKTILGHTEGAAGILSVIKVVKVLETGIIPPNHNFIEENPNINAKKLNIRFPLEPTPWPSSGIRRASINSFGFGGANGHVVIDDALSYLSEHNLHGFHQTVQKIPSIQSLQAPTAISAINGQARATNGVTNGLTNGQTNGFSDSHDTENLEIKNSLNQRLFVFSAFDKKGISRMGHNYQDWFRSDSIQSQKSQDPRFLDNFAYTLSHHRSTFNWRAYIVASNLDEVADRISTPKAVQMSSRSPNLAFVFTGQGAQWDGMIGALSQFSVYRKSIEEAAAYFRELGSQWNLTDLLDHRVILDRDDLTLTLPLVTVLQVAIVELLYSWGIKPRCVVGHSSGEVAAAYASGKIGRKAAWKTAYLRGIVAAKLSGQDGGMLAVALSPSKTKEYIRDYESAGKLTIACYNSPSNQTISGDLDAIDAVKATLDRDGIFARKLNVSNAYHSSHMLAGATEYTAALGDLQTGDKIPECNIEMISSVTGTVVTSKQLELPFYWTNNLVSPVRFTTALLKLCDESGIAFDDLIEIGPHSTLQSAINETLQNSISAGHSYHPTVKRKDTSATPILQTAGSLWCKGYPVRVEVINEMEPASMQLLTDLPPYKFNHETSFLLESRLSSNYRFREHPRMDLIGAPVPDWDPDHPKWRHFFRVKEIPWVAEHKITGQIISAGAGWVIMAIEGTKQLADPTLKVTGFLVREVALKSTLIIPETDEGVEVMMSMQWMPETSETSSKTWREFTITSFDQDSKAWRIHAKGLISIQYELNATSIDKDGKERTEDKAAKQQLAQITKNCRNPLDSEWVYGMFRAAGFDFKRRYKNLTDISISDGPDYFDVVGVVRNPDLTSVTAAGYVYPHTFHTVALDSVFHMGLPTILARLPKGTVPSPTIPAWIDEVWISADISSRADEGLKVCLHQYHDFWYGLRNDIIGFDENTSKRSLHIKGLKYHSLQSRQLSSITLAPCHQIQWEPDVDLISSDYFVQHSESSSQVNEAAVRLQHECVVSMLKLTEVIEHNPTSQIGLPVHLRSYILWLQGQQKALMQDKNSFVNVTVNGHATDSSTRDNLITHRIQLVQTVTERLVSLLEGKADPSAVLVQQRPDLHAVARECYDKGKLPKMLASYLSLLRHKRGNMRILEVGPGRGIVTQTVLEQFASLGDKNSHSTSFVSHYDFADNTDNDLLDDPDFKNLAIGYKKIDLESESVSKILETGLYDLVIFVNAPQSVNNNMVVVEKLHSCLNPGGKLVLLDYMDEPLWLPFVYGMSPHWWRDNASHDQGKGLLGYEGWDRILRQTGFTGAEVILDDRNDKASPMSIIISTAISKAIENDSARHGSNLVINMLGEGQSSFCQLFATKIAESTSSDQLLVKSLHAINGSDLSDVTCTVLFDGDDTSLTEPDDKTFESLKKLVTSCSRIFWVSRRTSKPHWSLACGFLRTARWERGGVNTDFSLLNMKRSLDDEQDIAHAIRLFKYHFLSGRAIRNSEYELQDGTISTNRVSEFEEVNDFREKYTFPGTKITLAPFRSKTGRSLRLKAQTQGRLETLHFVDDADANSPIAADEVEVKVAAVGLNFRDVVVALGEQNEDVYGLEGSGWVIRIGSDVENIQVGDRVVGVWSRERGYMRSTVKVHHAMVAKIPSNMSFEMAAAIPMNFTTVIYSLRDLAHLSREDKILIHSGAGGTGQGAIQYAQMVGAEVFTTVSTDKKKQHLIDTYGIPADHIFSSRTLDFATLILEATGGQGVDVVLNSLAGEALRKSLDCVAPLGRFIELGKKDIYANGRLQMKALRKSIAFFSVDMLTLFKRREAYSGKLLKESIELVDQKKIPVPPLLEVYKFSDMLPAFRRLQTGDIIGKIVLTVSDDNVVPTVTEGPQPLSFRHDSSYFIAGGLRGVGKVIAQWMVSHGARNLILVSRSGAQSPQTKAFVDGLRHSGCKVMAEACDIADENDIRRVLDVCKTMPPIRGCIQSAMVLKDKSIQNMTHEDWTAAIRPKVNGSWNLHTLLPADLDFFVMLSSITGVVGNHGQANYAAGNTFQDELARYRLSKGLRATSLDLSAISDVGWIAENSNMDTLLRGAAIQQLKEEDIFTILQYACNSARMPMSSALAGSLENRKNRDRTQIIVGLDDAAAIRRKGLQKPTYLSHGLFSIFAANYDGASEINTNGGSRSLPFELSICDSLTSATELIIDAIKLKLTDLTSTPAEDIDYKRTFSSYGVDSLVAVEFRSWLGEEVGADIAVLEIIGTKSIRSIAGKAATVSTFVKLRAEDGTR